MPTVQYWFSTASPWAWLGSARFAALAERAGAPVEVLPIELADVFAASGGTLFAQRPPARQSYRQLELARWSARLGVSIRLQPRHYPVERAPSSRLVIAAREAGLDALGLSHAVLGALWSQDRNIAHWPTLRSIADETGLDGEALVAAAQEPGTLQRYAEDTRRAIDAQVFGSPTYVVEGERFWGQDRLDLLAERLL
jgi:2-hydroxychromene-2-carboxylate isomerase